MFIYSDYNVYQRNWVLFAKGQLKLTKSRKWVNIFNIYVRTNRVNDEREMLRHFTEEDKKLILIDKKTDKLIYFIID